nr:electron transport complex subunit RsxC [Oceanococcus sp. HetDA_MAG_MS8]
MLNAQHDFRGGLALAGNKLYGEQAATCAAPLPRHLWIPLHQHQGPPAVPCVQPGQHVLRGDLIAKASTSASVAVHASSSGWVRAIESRDLDQGRSVDCILLETDQQDQARDEALGPCYTDPDATAAETIIERIAAAGIVGLGGASFPSATKLRAGVDRPTLEHIILNGAECEPYISCDGASMLEDAAAIIRGGQWLLAASGAQRLSIAIEDHHQAAIDSVNQALKRSADARIQLVQVPSRYPQGGERQLIQSLTGLEVPLDGLPLDLGLAMFNVATAVAVKQALEESQPLTERIVTVTGTAIAQPRNWRVRLGTPISELIAASGGLTHPDPAPRLLMGGAMMGVVLPDKDVPVSKGFNCLLVGPPSDIQPAAASRACIRCGDCVEVCPAGLLPQQLYWHSQAREFQAAAKLHLDACIECGACAVVCPSEIPLVQYYRYAKAELANAAVERRKAEHAKARYAAREKRLQREHAEREAARQRKQAALLQAEQTAAAKPADATSAAVAAALAKARAQQAKAKQALPPAVKAAQERARRQREHNSGSDN